LPVLDKTAIIVPKYIDWDGLKTIRRKPLVFALLNIYKKD
jgi:hypothetical protein